MVILTMMAVMPLELVVKAAEENNQIVVSTEDMRGGTTSKTIVDSAGNTGGS